LSKINESNIVTDFNFEGVKQLKNESNIVTDFNFEGVKQLKPIQ